MSITDDLREVIERVAASEGRLDYLVNNAGQNFGWQSIDEIAVEDFVRLLGINLVPYFAASKFALPHIRLVRGSIVNIGSIVSETGFYSNPDYTATKGAITSLTKALAVDESVNGVRVNAVLPGNVMTRRRALEAEAADGAALHEFMETWQWLGRSGTPEEMGTLCSSSPATTRATSPAPRSSSVAGSSSASAASSHSRRSSEPVARPTRLRAGRIARWSSPT